ncbi:MAG: hypothetical protein ACLQQ4_07290 [Bacteroidia bacterium]
MFKLPRFNAYKHPQKPISEETEPDGEWSQHITLPLPPSVYAAYRKVRGEADLVSKSAAITKPINNSPRNNEHILSAIGDLIRALDIDGHDLIQYILDNDLVKGVASEKP